METYSACIELLSLFIDILLFTLWNILFKNFCYRIQKSDLISYCQIQNGWAHLVNEFYLSWTNVSLFFVELLIVHIFLCIKTQYGICIKTHKKQCLIMVCNNPFSRSFEKVSLILHALKVQSVHWQFTSNSQFLLMDVFNLASS